MIRKQIQLNRGRHIILQNYEIANVNKLSSHQIQQQQLQLLSDKMRKVGNLRNVPSNDATRQLKSRKKKAQLGRVSDKIMIDFNRKREMEYERNLRYFNRSLMPSNTRENAVMR